MFDVFSNLFQFFSTHYCTLSKIKNDSPWVIFTHFLQKYTLLHSNLFSSECYKKCSVFVIGPYKIIRLQSCIQLGKTHVYNYCTSRISESEIKHYKMTAHRNLSSIK